MRILNITSGGGLGDFIFNYYKRKDWRSLSEVKKRFPNIKVTAVLCHHSITASELISTNPYIDAIIHYPWYPPGDSKEYLWKEFIIGEPIENFIARENIKENDNKLFLTKEEEDRLNEIKAQGPYVVMHPFAGQLHRSCYGVNGKYTCYTLDQYINTAEQLFNSGYKVYIIGRSTYDGQYPGRDKVEKIYDPPKWIDSFANEFSTRMNVKLVRNATGFLGAHSSMLSAAWTADVPSIFFYPTCDEQGSYEYPKNVLTDGGYTGIWAITKPYNSFYQLNDIGFANLDPKTVANKLQTLINIRSKDV